MFEFVKRLFESKEQTAARLKAEDARLKEEARLNLLSIIKENERQKAEAAAQAKADEIARKLAKVKAEKARKELADKIKAAKKLVKEKGLRRTRRDGQTVYVNKNGSISNDLLLYYLLFHTNNETYGRDSGYTTEVHSNAQEASSSDWSGSFSGGDSGGGGTSSSWSDDSSGSSSSDFGGSFGGGDSGSSGGDSGGSSGSW